MPADTQVHGTAGEPGRLATQAPAGPAPVAPVEPRAADVAAPAAPAAAAEPRDADTSAVDPAEPQPNLADTRNGDRRIGAMVRGQLGAKSDPGAMPLDLIGFLRWLVVGLADTVMAAGRAGLATLGIAAIGAMRVARGIRRVLTSRSVREALAAMRLERLQDRVGRDIQRANERLAAAEQRTGQAVADAYVKAAAVRGAAGQRRTELVQWATEQGGTVVREARERADQQMSAARQAVDTEVERIREVRGDDAARTARERFDRDLNHFQGIADSVVTNAERQRDAMVRTAHQAGDRIDLAARVHANAIVTEAVSRAGTALNEAREAHQTFVDASLNRQAGAERSVQNYQDGLLPWDDLTADMNGAAKEQKKEYATFAEQMGAAEAALAQGGVSLATPPIQPMAAGNRWKNADQLFAEEARKHNGPGQPRPTQDNPRGRTPTPGQGQLPAASRQRQPPPTTQQKKGVGAS